MDPQASYLLRKYFNEYKKAMDTFSEIHFVVNTCTYTVNKKTMYDFFEISESYCWKFEIVKMEIRDVDFANSET